MFSRKSTHDPTLTHLRPSSAITPTFLLPFSHNNVREPVQILRKHATEDERNEQ